MTESRLLFHVKDIHRSIYCHNIEISVQQLQLDANLFSVEVVSGKSPSHSISSNRMGAFLLRGSAGSPTSTAPAVPITFVQNRSTCSSPRIPLSVSTASSTHTTCTEDPCKQGNTTDSSSSSFVSHRCSISWPCSGLWSNFYEACIVKPGSYFSPTSRRQPPSHIFTPTNRRTGSYFGVCRRRFHTAEYPASRRQYSPSSI